MSKAKRHVYIETSIPSFYYEVRTEPEMLARRDWTREWWDEHSTDFDLMTSEAVIDELESGDFPQKSDALALVEPLDLLDIDDAVADIVDAYIKHRVMPIDPTGDAPPWRKRHMKEDPAIQLVRDSRRRISAAVGHDARKLVERYRRLQERHRERLISHEGEPSRHR